jgi:hypothetical protein
MGDYEKLQFNSIVTGPPKKICIIGGSVSGKSMLVVDIINRFLKYNKNSKVHLLGDGCDEYMSCNFISPLRILYETHLSTSNDNKINAGDLVHINNSNMKHHTYAKLLRNHRRMGIFVTIEVSMVRQIRQSQIHQFDYFLLKRNNDIRRLYNFYWLDAYNTFELFQTTYNTLTDNYGTLCIDIFNHKIYKYKKSLFDAAAMWKKCITYMIAKKYLDLILIPDLNRLVITYAKS